MGGDGDALEVLVRASVGSAEVQDGSREHHRRERVVGPAVHDDVGIPLLQLARIVDHGANLDERGVALGRRPEVFVSPIHHLHGLARLDGEQRGMGGQHGGVLLFAAEAAAGRGLDHVHALVAEHRASAFSM